MLNHAWQILILVSKFNSCLVNITFAYPVLFILALYCIVDGSEIIFQQNVFLKSIRFQVMGVNLLPNIEKLGFFGNKWATS